MKYSSIIKANGIIIALSIVLLAIFSDKLIPDTKTVHHEYTVKKSYVETDQSIFGTWREYYLVTDHGTFKVSGKYKFDEEVTVNGKR